MNGGVKSDFVDISLDTLILYEVSNKYSRLISCRMVVRQSATGKEDKLSLPGEIWKIHPDDSHVQISNMGRVKRYNKIVKLTNRDRDGYVRVTINGKTKRLHRVVAELFVPNPDNLPVVDHINNIHDDNRADNLRFCTVQQNTQWAADMGLQTRHMRGTSVVLLVDQEDNGYLFDSVADACRYANIPKKEGYKLTAHKSEQYKGWRIIKVETLSNQSKRLDYCTTNLLSKKKSSVK